MFNYLKKAAVIGVSALAFSSSANADLSWTISPDANALAFGVTVVNGVAQIGSADFPGTGSAQPAGIFGAGFTYTGSSFFMDFDADLYSWDAYNTPTTTGTGWWDAFIVTVSTTGFYWNSSPSDPVTASASTWVWGGTNFADNVLESYTTAPGGPLDQISLAAGPATYYVSVVLDTKTLPSSDNQHPSWGSFHVTPIPEPEIYAMMAAGLALMGWVGRRRKNGIFAA